MKLGWLTLVLAAAAWPSSLIAQSPASIEGWPEEVSDVARETGEAPGTAAPERTDHAPAVAMPPARSPLERPLPWAAIAGLALGLAARARAVGWRAFARGAIAPAAVFTLTLLGRLLVMPFGFFHQNGQGPVWIEQTLRGASDYGPGYEQLFGALAAAATDPERSVFAAQATLAAIGVAAAFVLARRIAGMRVASAVAVALASSPILMRLAHGESYFAAQGSLLLVATAVLFPSAADRDAALGGETTSDGPSASERARISVAVVSTIGCALLLCQVVWTHPVAWVPAAMVPSALLAVPGSLARRVLRVVGTTLVCAGVGILVTFPSVRAVLEGRLGATWLAPHGHHGVAIGPFLVLASIVAVAVRLRRSAAWARVGVPATSLALLLWLARWADLLGPSASHVHLAWLTLFSGPGLALALAILCRSVRPNVAPAVVLAAAALIHLGTVGPSLRPSTDAMEGNAALDWRERLPEGAVVVFLARGERRVLTLPLHRFATRPLAVGERWCELGGGEVYWYRSGLCSTDEGRATCDAIEAAHTLRPVFEETLPARASIDDLPYDTASVSVGLYRIEPRR